MGGYLTLGVSAVASPCCELIQIGIDAYIPHCRCQVKSH